MEIRRTLTTYVTILSHVLLMMRDGEPVAIGLFLMIRTKLQLYLLYQGVKQSDMVSGDDCPIIICHCMCRDGIQNLSTGTESD
jgi:hypothetical protein